MTNHPVLIDVATRAIDQELTRVARGNVNVLLLGETGTGKEVFAERVHAASRRAGGPFVRINCAALTETLLESELFGHVRGAFTGAMTARTGLIEAAHGGSVLLDEIGELPLPTQAKLLRVIEERAVLPIGSTELHPIDVRFIAATNRSLPDEVTCGRFRSDLMYRVGAYVVRLPPLRERREEIEPLTDLFLTRCGATVRPSAEARAALRAYDWPGNIRQLRNVIETAALLCESGSIQACHLRFAVPSIASAPPPPPAQPTANRTLREQLESVEREAIQDALERCRGNQRTAARMLGVSRATLMTRLDRLAIPRPRKGRRLTLASSAS